ncbi:MAG TPA: phytoene/squalene synthase family protein [Pseudolabrys sp.]|nr:phytoene/squalene synthase family protein [Pseudolabrys sp.]
MTSNAEHCAALVREADRDLFLATLFAPEPHRDALFALYAFTIEIARVRDLARESMPGEIRLQWWRESLAGERDAEAQAHPVAAALRATLIRYGLSADPLMALIDARTFDLYDQPMDSLHALDTYAQATRGAVFAFAAAVLGGLVQQTRALAQHAGIAYTIAGAVSNLPLHAARRQLYLPRELLDRHGLVPEAVFARETSEGLCAALADLRGHARAHLGAGGALLPEIPAAALPAFLPLASIGALLREMDRPAYDPFRPPRLSALRRQWLLWRAARDPRRIFSV